MHAFASAVDAYLEATGDDAGVRCKGFKVGGRHKPDTIVGMKRSENGKRMEIAC
jgi:hypothetical protein